MTARFLHTLRLLLCLHALLLVPDAQATCTHGACVTAGPRLASIDSTRGTLLNAVMGRLLSSTSINVLDWNSVAQADIKLGLFINALQTQTSTLTPDAALAFNATPAQIFTAAASAANADGATAAATALNTLSAQVAPLTDRVKVGDLLDVDFPVGMLANTRINLLDLITGSAQLFNYRNVLTTSPSPVSLTGVQVGQSSLINSVDLYLQVVEPPVILCGPSSGSVQFHSAAIRVKFNLDLVDLNPNASSLNGLGSLGLGFVASASVTIAQMQLYLEVARTSGTIQAVNAINSAITVHATPGVTDLFIGQIADSVFFNRTHDILDSEVSFATIGSLNMTVAGLPVNTSIQMKAIAHGTAPSNNVLNFSGPYPETKTATTSALFVSNLLSSLTSSLQVQLSPSLLLDSLLLTPIKTIVSNALITPVVSPLLTGLVDPLLSLFGMQLGQSQITVNGAMYGCTLSGRAYSDTNHNAALDSSEAGCGQTLWAKLVPSGTPSGPALEAVSVNSSTGVYSFASVTAGTGYSIVLDTNATLSDVTATMPSGWLNTEASTGTRSLTMPHGDLGNQNFGLYNGSRVSGTVFKDNGIGGGSANNGTQDGSEGGLASVTVKATNAAGSVTHDTTTTSTSGSFTLWIPAAVGSATVERDGDESPRPHLGCRQCRHHQRQLHDWHRHGQFHQYRGQHLYRTALRRRTTQRAQHRQPAEHPARQRRLLPARLHRRHGRASHALAQRHCDPQRHLVRPALSRQQLQRRARRR
ncbi:MAG: hypothetical protein QM776_17890 [Rhodocyclaceae bacterium]